MTQEEKQLLLKDLCVRLPYGVRVKISDEDILLYDSEKGTLDGKENMGDDCFVIKCSNDSWIISCEDFKPYLRPMSSMTEEEKLQLIRYAIIGDGQIAGIDFVDWVERKNVPNYIDWLNAHHFDYRGLIEKGLALEAPEDMYKNK